MEGRRSYGLPSDPQVAAAPDLSPGPRWRGTWPSLRDRHLRRSPRVRPYGGAGGTRGGENTQTCHGRGAGLVQQGRETGGLAWDRDRNGISGVFWEWIRFLSL